MVRSVHVQVLLRAAEILGGNAQLRAHLRVSIRDLEEWMTGVQRVPSHIFLRAVDLISEPSPLLQADVATRAASLRVKAALLARAASASREEAARVIERAGTARRRSARVLDDALQAALKRSDARRGNVQLRQPDGLRIVAQLGFDRPFLDFFALVTADASCACGSALAHGRRVIVPDVDTHPIFAGTAAARVMRDAGARACQSTPLVAPSGKVLGMLSTHYEEPREPTAAELAAIDDVAAQLVQRLVLQ